MSFVMELSLVSHKIETKFILHLILLIQILLSKNSAQFQIDRNSPKNVIIGVKKLFIGISYN